MAHILTLADGETVVDIDTREGQIEYVAHYLNSKGASSDVWSCFTKAMRQEKTQIRSCGADQNPESGDCQSCNGFIQVYAEYCPACGRKVVR